MTYAQAKAVAYDHDCTDRQKLIQAASVLAGRTNATDDDMYEAQDLAERARRIPA